MEYRFIPFDWQQKEHWDQFVGAHPHAWPGQHAAIMEFERLRGNPSRSHLVMDQNDRVLAVSPLFLSSYRQARVFRFRTLVSGSSLRGAPLLTHGLAPKRRRSLLDAYCDWLKGLAVREGVDEVLVYFPHRLGDRFNTDFYPYNPLMDYGFRHLPNFTMIKDLQPDPQALFADLSTSHRRKIRRTEEAGAQFEPIEDHKVWMACHQLNLDTFEGEDYAAYTEETLALVWDEFVTKGHAHVFGLRYEGELANVMVTVGTPHSQYYWMGFGRRPRPLAGGTHYLMWKAILWHKARGVGTFELGALETGSERSKGIARFKRGFGGEIRLSMDAALSVSPVKKASAEWIQALVSVMRNRRSRSTRTEDDNDT